MSTRVKDYMMKEINTIDYDTSIKDAANVMATDPNFEGYVIILKKGKPLGIITERDIVNKVTAQAVNPLNVKVTEIMSTPLITIDPDDDLLKASELMGENNITKLVVMKGDIIYGVVTAKDIAQHSNKYVNKAIKDVLRWTGMILQ